MAVHFGQFERAAAEIADNPVRLVEAGDHAKRGELAPRACRKGRRSWCRRCARPRATKDLPFLASRQAAVAIAQQRRDLKPVAQRAKAPQRRQRLLDRIGCQQARCDCTSRPSPASTFSLKIGVGLRVSPS